MQSWVEGCSGRGNSMFKGPTVIQDQKDVPGADSLGVKGGDVPGELTRL